MEESGSILQLWILGFLAICSAFFSSSETALMSSNRFRLRKQMEEGDSGARRAIDLLEDTGGLLTTILVGNNIVNILLATLATSLAISYFGNVNGPIISSIGATIILLIFGEIVPKTVASKQAEKLASVVSFPISLIKTLLKPLVFIFGGINNLVIKLMGYDQNENSVTQEDILTIATVGKEEGVIDHEEHYMIHSVIELRETLAREVMIPRIKMAAVEVNITLEELLKKFKTEGYSRLPVYKQSIDNIVGVVYLKDLIDYIVTNTTSMDLSKVMRPVFFVHETKKLDVLFNEMRKQKTHIALVIDDFGGTAGLVTLEDILEEIVGEIRDEFDLDEVEPLVQVSEDTWLADGSLPLQDLSHGLKKHIHCHESETLNGYILNRLGNIPREQDVLETDDLIFTVDKVVGKRICRIRIKLKD